MKAALFLLLLLSASTGRTQDTTAMPLLDLDVRLVREVYTKGDVLLFNMHDNENTSAAAGRIMARKFGGDFFELVHSGKRPLSFTYEGDSVHIDPNRIYTDQGIWTQLKYNRKTRPELHKIIRDWRDTLLDHLQLDRRAIVIAMHNNTDQRYSYYSYMPDSLYAAEASRLYPGRLADPDNFFFLTDDEHMELLSAGRYALVLQDNSAMTDDGSLSVYCGQGGIPYVNIEAQHGHLLRQLQMLAYLYGRLRL